MEETHTRITLGTTDEMRRAVEVFRRVLNAKATTAGTLYSRFHFDVARSKEDHGHGTDTDGFHGST